jgi:EAL domain-containing protein (putative c-di-GMP-specific phosphodiesterase class I)
VETPKQVEFLYDADADQVQGFYFGKPVPPSEAAVDILAELHKTAVTEPAAPAAQPLKTSAG